MAQVPTARGDFIDTAEMGFTLPVEMVFLISSGDANANWPDISFDAVPEEERIADAVAKFHYAYEHCGVRTIVDRTLPGIGRDVRRVKKVAQQVPVNIIVCTGWYTWDTLPFFFSFSEHEEWSKQLKDPRPKLEDLFVRDIEEGIAGTGVRAGLIKFVTDHPGLSGDVPNLGRSVARAHRRTGTPITTHTGMGVGVKSGLMQIELFEKEGVDLTRVQIGHVDMSQPDAPLDDFKRIMDKGALVSFDTLAPTGMFPPVFHEKRIERIVELCKQGYSVRIMVSSDSACWHDLFPVGTIESEFAYPTYCHVTMGLLPELRENGVSEADIEQMTVKNPQRLFESKARGPY